MPVRGRGYRKRCRWAGPRYRNRGSGGRVRVSGCRVRVRMDRVRDCAMCSGGGGEGESCCRALAGRCGSGEIQ